jgi:hypothetical protein
MGYLRNSYHILIGKPERMSSKTRRKWEDNNKMDINYVRYDGVDWIHVAQNRGQW